MEDQCIMHAVPVTDDDATESRLRTEMMNMKTALALAVLGSAVTAGIVYRAIQPPPPRVCGSPGGPPVTSPRVTLRDGRRLAYLESGATPCATARHRVVFVHGFDSCRHDVLPVADSFLREHGVCVISYDRPGYGESDPDPSRTEESSALDVADLADRRLGGPEERFYVVGFSMGGQLVWSCLRHIPHRLAGAALLAPVANFWWRGFPADVAREAYAAQLPQDRWAVGVAHHAPWLTHWWNTQRWFPPSSVVAHSPRVLSPPDLEVAAKLAAAAAGPPKPPHHRAQVRQQGEFEALHRDMMVGFGDWGYSPLELSDPAPGKNGAVQLWHGAEDLVVAPVMSRHIASQLPWIQYRELPNAGHLFPLADGMGELILRSLLQLEQCTEPY